MNWLRNSLIGAILVVVFYLFIQWNEFKEQKNAEEAPVETPISSTYYNNSQSVPNFDSDPGQSPLVDNYSNSTEFDDLPKLEDYQLVSTTARSAPENNVSLISVKTDTLDLIIDPLGGDIVGLSLPKYLAELDQPDSEFLLLNRSSSHTYISQSDLMGQNGTHTSAGRTLFSSASRAYSLNSNTDSLVVDLYIEQNQATITKRFTFHRDSYLIDVAYLIENHSDSEWKANMYGLIKRDDYRPPSNVSIGMKSFVGAAYTTKDINYEKLDLDDLDDEEIKFDNQGGWVAMVQHYFMSAWIPNPESTNHYKLYKSKDNKNYMLSFTTDVLTVPPHSEGSIQASYYAGPKIIKDLKEISPHLHLTIDFSWLWFIAIPLFKALDFIHGFVGNWGISIILLTCVVKLIFFYPSAMSYRSMAKMRKIMPLMTDLKERYGDDRQRMGAETMKLYKKEGVNPLGGCLPMLMQMPVFISLYWTLMESVELRHSPFFLWIIDLAVKDPYFVLPLIMGATMYFQQKLNPAPADPMQAKIMQMLPIFFTFLFMTFPAGLVLYWVTNNLLSITQQYIITKRIENS
ncbi:MAG: YidC/Oxa1 family membrane protein insertase [Lentisphaeria bacterium]|jgi:YidC/Oxa1 family membrane protein insertase